MGPAIGDQFAESFRYYIEWGDGRDTAPTTDVPDSNGGPGVQSTGTFLGGHIYADDGVYTVTVRIADDNMTGNFTGGVDGADFVEKTFTVTVTNVRPTLSATPSTTSINEGSTVSFVANFADFGFDNPLNTNPTAGPTIGDQFAESFRYYIEWGDGRDTLPSTNVADMNGGPDFQSTGTFNGSHTYADDGVYTVRVRIADDNMTGNFVAGTLDVDFVEYSFSVTVNNVDPTLRNIAGLEVNEGQAFVLTSDGLEATKNLGVLLEDPGFDNASNPNPATVQIPNPKEELFTGMSIDWGDGTGTTSLTIDNNLRTVGSPGVMTTAPLMHASHTYADDGVYTVSVTFKDDNGPFVTREILITVKNVVPILGIASVASAPDPDANPSTILESGDVSFVANFSDPGFDNANNPNAAVQPLISLPKEESFRFFINWGDGRDEVGTMAVADLNGAVGMRSTGTFSATHNYADDGVYTVTVRIADDNMLAFVDPSKFALNTDGENGGVIGVDFVEQIFQITVQNIDPQFIPNAAGESFEGDDISSEGITTIRVSYQDIGYDNPNNRNAAVLPDISNPKYEIFTHLLDWGDGSVDAIHTYAVPGNYTIAVTVAGADLNGTFSFNEFPGSTSSVLTLVSGQTLNVGGESAYTYIINWGDGTIQTVTLDLFLPLAPQAGNGLTTVMTALRANGDANSNTTGAIEVQHRYLGPPNPLNPTADIGITVTVVDDNNATVSDIIFVPNPGIDVVNQRIDTTPQIPRLDFPTPPAIQALLQQTAGTIQSLQSSDVGSAGGETASTSKRYLELVAYAPDGTVIDRYELPEEELADLRKLFARLPDGRYQIFLVRTDTNTRRLVMDVFVRRGRLIERRDDTEGTRDRPPTSESEENAAANDEGPALQPAANEAGGNAATLPADVHPKEQIPAPSYTSLRWGSSLAGLAMVSGGSRWSRTVDAALAQADRRAWQRLRRAGRLGGASLNHEQPNGRRAAHRS
jgi:PKD repeat protein